MRRLRPLAFTAAVVLAAAALAQAGAGGQEHTRNVTVTARRFAFDPAIIEVQQDDLVKITFRTEDVPHSFTIDDYRIAKRVRPGQTTTFEFRADKAGTFSFYCNIKTEDGCRQMKGRLIVRPRE
jgi:cytochrome c oxidase subunit 2